MPTAVEIAGKYLQNADVIVRAAQKVGLELAVACALIQKESGGRNVFGSDGGGLYKGEPVTEAKYKAMVAKVKNGATSNGVGLTQITYAGQKKNGRRDGGFFTQAEQQGLKLWQPYENCLFGFALLLDLYNANGRSWSKAGHRYNGAAAYGADLAKKITTWRARLAGITMPTDPEETPVARKTFRGKTFDARTAAMLAEVARRTRAYVQPTQGSYNNSVGASAGTHSGGGAVDLHCASLPEDQALEIVRVMREVGFAAWMRKPSEGNWPEHIHGIAIGCPDLSPSAKRQVTAYRNGLSGLASGRKDRHAGMGIKPTTWEQYLARITNGTAPKVKVSLRNLIAAAKTDPKAAQGVGRHPADVKVVEAALAAEGLLTGTLAKDGAYGTATVEAYADWQERCGYSGKDADGVPGKTSLTKLAKKYGFEVAA